MRPPVPNTGFDKIERGKLVRMHARIVITEEGETASATHLILGNTDQGVQEHAMKQLERIIEQIAKDHPNAAPSDDEIQSARKYGAWWADLGSEEFTVMILEPEKVERVTPLLIEVALEKGLVIDVKAPQGVQVMVRDYDLDGAGATRVDQDDNGRPCITFIWEGDLP